MGEIYARRKESSYITYADANNLYGWAMVQPLPYKDIKFETWHPTSDTISDEPDPETFRTLSPPTLATNCAETFRTISEPNSATLLTNSETHSAMLQTVDFLTLRINSGTFLSIILETPDDADTDYFVEVDLEFPPINTYET